MPVRCRHCQNAFVDEAAQACPECGRPLAMTEPDPRAPGQDTPPASPTPGPAEPPPRRPLARMQQGIPAFEDRSKPWLSRFARTWFDATFRPSAFFAELARAGGGAASRFGYVCTLLGTALGAGWNLLFLPLWSKLAAESARELSPEDLANLEKASQDSVLAQFLRDSLQAQPELPSLMHQLEAQMWVTLLLAPVSAYFTLHLVAGLVHFCVQPFRVGLETQIPYEVTFRFVGYALAPMALAALPSVGGIAGLYTLVVLALAMRNLHQIRGLGLLSGVISPVLLLSFVWHQEALPRVAARVAEGWRAPAAARSAPAGAAGSPAVRTADELADEAAEAALAALPPLPPHDRDHSVEVREADGFQETMRVFHSSQGPLRIRHRARPEAAGGLRVEVEVRNESDAPLSFAIEHAALNGARVSELRADGGAQADVMEADKPTAHFRDVAPTAAGRLQFVVVPGDARALLQVGPTVWLASP